MLRIAIHALLVLLFANYATGYNILFVTSFTSTSHVIGMLPVAEELGRRGHQVTFMTPILIPSTAVNVKQVFLSQTAEYLRIHDTNFFDVNPLDVRFLPRMFARVTAACNVTYREPEVQDLLRNTTTSDGKPRFDTVVVDAVMNEYLLGIGHHLGVPNIFLNPAAIYAAHAWNMNIPHPYSYIPCLVRPFASDFTFRQRVQITITNVIYMLTRWSLLFRPCEQMINDNFLPGTPSLSQLENKVSFYISNSHFSLHTSLPNMPYFVEAGCLHCKEAKPLPSDIEDYFRSAGEDGVVYVSFGSIAKGKYFPQEFTKKLLGAFAQLNQKVLFKMEVDIPNLPANVRLIKWAAQQDIIAHPQVRLFVSHGGGLSTFEAAFHGCPLIGFPLGSDQSSIMAMAEHRGFAKPMDWKTFTTEDLLANMIEILNNSSYKTNALAVSSLLKDRPQPPVETAAYWIEYVIRHKGAPHLKSGAEHLNFFQYFLVDVIAGLMLVVLASAVLISVLIIISYKFVLRHLRNDNKLKTKQD